MAIKKIVAEISASLITLMFTYAAVSKLFIYDAYRFELLGHQLIKNYASFIALGLPVAELMIVAFILINRTHRMGLYFSVALLTFFTGYIIYMFKVYPSTPCSCGGVLSSMSWRQHIVFNIFFIALSLLSLKWGKADEPTYSPTHMHA